MKGVSTMIKRSFSLSRGSLAIALTLAIAGALPLAVFAATGVKIAGNDAFAISTGAGGMSVTQRAQVVQTNLDNALVAAADKGPAAVKIVYVKGTPVVTVGGYHVVTVDGASAKAAGTTPAVLAQRWSEGLKRSLSDQTSVQRYVAQLTGDTAGGGASYKARVVYVPAGMVLPIKLNTTVTTQTAQAGDPIQAELSQDINLGDNVIPAGSVISGKIVASKSGDRMAKSGQMSIKFDSLRTPDGTASPIKAHIVGGVDKFDKNGDGTTLKGESTSNKVKTAAVHGAIGAGTGALAGIAIGAIASRGHRVGTGAWSGAAIGAGLGVAESLLLRKGKDVVLQSGEELKLQLDAPATLAITGSTGTM
jgi:hypothetical protein